MNNFLYFYIEANIFCIIISLVLFLREIKNVDKRLRNIEFLKTISIYILFYAFDIIGRFVGLGLIAQESFIGHLIYFCLFVIFTYGSYQWFIYSEVTQGNSEIYKFRNRIKWIIPIAVFCVFILVYTLAIYIKEGRIVFLRYKTFIHLSMAFTAFLYEVISCVKSLKRVVVNKRHISKGFYIYMGINPIIFTSIIILQISFPTIPIFCFLNVIFMLYFYLRGLDQIISIDSLTKLNNRNQLNKYFYKIKHDSEYKNYILVIDIDNFKGINDKYGHLEGDNALVLVADTFRQVCEKYMYKLFISRYGGDEFVIIAQANDKKDVELLKDMIKKQIAHNATKAGKEYELSVSIGISVIQEDHNRLNASLARADEEMYLEKKQKAALKK